MAILLLSMLALTSCGAKMLSNSDDRYIIGPSETDVRNQLVKNLLMLKKTDMPEWALSNQIPLDEDLDQEQLTHTDTEEVISEGEKEDIQELIEWMSIEQTVMMSCIGAMTLSVLVICAMKLCAAQPQEDLERSGDMALFSNQNLQSSAAQ